MHTIDQIYIDGAFVTPHGEERFELFNPATEEVIGTVRLADQEDAHRAIAAAKRALPAFSRTTVAERIALLRRMHAAVEARGDELFAAVLEDDVHELLFGGCMFFDGDYALFGEHEAD